MLKRLIDLVRCTIFGHKAMFLVSAMGQQILTIHDHAGRQLVGFNMCRHCHTIFWTRGLDVPSSFNTGYEIELFDARNHVNRMTKEIEREARDRGPEAA